MIDFIIIGAQKGGTTAAAFNLNKHPGITMFTGKTEYGQSEIEFFNQHWDRGANWYFEQIPRAKGKCGEKTAELLHRKICHERMSVVVPGAKLIVLLRCPVKRAFSQWRMSAFNKGDETRSFDEVIKQEYQKLYDSNYKNDFYSCTNTGMNCWREGYILKGFYYEQLKSLYRFFSDSSVHVAVSEQISNNKVAGYNKMFEFLGLDKFKSDFEDRFIGRVGPPINRKTYELLQDIYRVPNEQLFNLIGYKIKEWSAT